ncbi:MAG: cytochrome c oxidase subunit II [Gammaproteobacteria bacterium]
MSVRSRKWFTRGLLGAILPLAAGNALAGYALNMPQGVTPISHDIYHLHMMILWICVAIGVVVFGAMIYSIIKHRKSKGAVAAQFHESTAIEIAWTVVPFVILIAMAIPATRTLVAMEDVSNADMTIKITGYQWKWRYDYLNSGIGFFSTLSTPKAEIYNEKPKDANYLLEVDHPLVVPINKKIRMLTTAGDVIHSWWVPDLGAKKDAIPGYINEFWIKIDKPGVYRGQCAELCGKDHGFMPIVVVAKTEKDYEQWVAQQKAEENAAKASNHRTWTKDELIANGKKVFGANCAACHQASGEGIPGNFPPLVQGKTFTASSDLQKHLRDRGFLSADNKIVMGPVKHHLDIVLNGIPGTAMQAFASQLSDADIASVVTYERNSWGNDTGDVIQPADVKAAR